MRILTGVEFRRLDVCDRAEYVVDRTATVPELVDWSELSARIATSGEMSSESAGIRRAVELAGRMGVEVNLEQSPQSAGAHWDGRQSFVGDQNVSNIVHEVAHFQVASPERRKLLEFGLGQSPAVGYGAYKDVMPKETLGLGDSTLEESRASLLGILWQLHLGIADPSWTWSEHSWDCGEVNEGADTLMDLYEEGYIDHNAEPRYFLRTTDDSIYDVDY